MHTVSCGMNCQIPPQSADLDAASAAAAEQQLLAAAAAGVQLRAVAAPAAAVAAAAAATGLIVAAGGTGGGRSQGWLGSWQTVAGRRGRAWAGEIGAVGRG